jgi:MraZ protein
MDAKGRTSLPARFRGVLAASGDIRLVVTPGLPDPSNRERYLDVYPMEEWEQVEAKVASRSKLDPDIVRFRRMYLSAAVDCELDKHGRLLIPPSLREHAALRKSVLWAGVGSKIELWSRERWDEAQRIDEMEIARWRSVIGEKLDL